MSLISRVTMELIATLTSSTDFSTPAAPYDLRQQFDYTSGTGAGQADRIWVDQRTLAASTTEDIDLAGGVTDPFGAAITFVKIKALLIRAAGTNTNNVVVGAAASNAWAALLGTTGTLTIRPGMAFKVAVSTADATGLAVVAGTGDLLKVANSGAGTGVTFDIGVIGTSA